MVIKYWPSTSPFLRVTYPLHHPFARFWSYIPAYIKVSFVLNKVGAEHLKRQYFKRWQKKKKKSAAVGHCQDFPCKLKKETRKRQKWLHTAIGWTHITQQWYPGSLPSSSITELVGQPTIYSYMDHTEDKKNWHMSSQPRESVMFSFLLYSSK